MHCTTCPQIISLSAPWPLQVWRTFTGVLAGWRLTGRAGGRTATVQRDGVDSAIDERVLRDIGAPDWLQVESRAHERSRHIERDLMREQFRASAGRFF
jgi:hypothetical protein